VSGGRFTSAGGTFIAIASLIYILDPQKRRVVAALQRPLAWTNILEWIHPPSTLSGNEWDESTGSISPLKLAR